MNQDLYRALVDLGVFPQPAEDLAHMYDGGEYLTKKVVTANANLALSATSGRPTASRSPFGVCATAS
jgi:hypothetical protein